MKNMKFDAQLAHEIKAGRKTQTRRLIDPQPVIVGSARFFPEPKHNIGEILTVNHVMGQIRIVKIRAQQVRDITEEDAIAEGCYRRITNMRLDAIALTQRGFEASGPCERTTAIEEFKKLWESIYPGSWERGEWVWVYEFRRVEA